MVCKVLRINGCETDAAGKTLADYLRESGYDCARIAVEINLSIIPKSKYGETVLCDGDSVEIVSFVGGG